MKGITPSSEFIETLVDIFSGYNEASIRQAIREIYVKYERLPDNPIHAVLNILNPKRDAVAFTKEMIEKMNRDNSDENFTSEQRLFYKQFSDWGHFINSRDLNKKAEEFLNG
jgi:hypothetical protein